MGRGPMAQRRLGAGSNMSGFSGGAFLGGNKEEQELSGTREDMEGPKPRGVTAPTPGPADACEFRGGSFVAQAEATAPANPLGGGRGGSSENENVLPWQLRQHQARPHRPPLMGLPFLWGERLGAQHGNTESHGGKWRARAVLCQ